MLKGYHDGVGCKSETRHLCERDHYPQVKAEYGVLGLLWLTATNPHYQHFQECYEEASRLLTTICDERPGSPLRRSQRAARSRTKQQSAGS